jgi:hypothetical protein
MITEGQTIQWTKEKGHMNKHRKVWRYQRGNQMWMKLYHFFQWMRNFLPLQSTWGLPRFSMNEELPTPTEYLSSSSLFNEWRTSYPYRVPGFFLAFQWMGNVIPLQSTWVLPRFSMNEELPTLTEYLSSSSLFNEWGTSYPYRVFEFFLAFQWTRNFLPLHSTWVLPRFTMNKELPTLT